MSALPPKADIETQPRKADIDYRAQPVTRDDNAVTGNDNYVVTTAGMIIRSRPRLDERQRLRTKAVADGVWPPPGGPDQLLAQQADVFLPAEFSPLR